MSLIIVIGRGHSGTRVISHTLYASGVYMGNLLNHSGDLVPAEPVYKACRIMGEHISWVEDLKWDFKQLHTMDIPLEFADLINKYLAPVLNSTVEHKGWKLPETTLIYPWITRMFPNNKYIYLIRNPRDCILESHLTDDLGKFGVDCSTSQDERFRRAVSWKYQYELVKTTPKPKHWLEIRFEDFVLNQDKTLAKLEDFLEMKLAKIVVRPDAVDRWKQDNEINYYDFFAPAMIEYDYEIPDTENLKS